MMRAMIVTKLEYRSDLVMSFIGAVAFQASPLAAYVVVTAHAPNLAGWNGNQVLFLFGMWAMALGMTEMLFDNVWSIGNNVRMGIFDRLLVYPVASLPFYLMCDPQVHSLANMAIGAVMVSYSLFQEHQPWWAWACVPFWVVCGSFIYISLLVLISAPRILWPGMAADTALIAQLGNASRYPVSIYPRVVQSILLFVLPMASYLFLPGQWLFHGGSAAQGLLIPPLAACILVVLAWKAWGAALNRYESTGS